jgi:hypothetical protein
MEVNPKKEAFVHGEHFNNIPLWSAEQCIKFLGIAETTQKTLKGADKSPARARHAVQLRLVQLINESGSDLCISEADYLIAVNTFNSMKFILEKVLQGSHFPLIRYGSTAAMEEDLQNLQTYTLRVAKALQEMNK